MSGFAIFRKVSLDRLASPEQLDQLMRVTDLRGWVALVSIGAVLATGVVWGFAGSVPENVNGMGILVRSGGVFEIVAPTSGRVVDVAVGVGDAVTQGQVVGRMEQPDLSDQLQRARDRLATLRMQNRDLVVRGSGDVALQEQALAKERVTVEQANASARQGLVWYKEKVVVQERLADEGLLTRQTVLNTRQQLDAAQEKINEGQGQLAQVAVRQLELRNRRREDLQQSEIRIQEQAQTVAQQEKQLAARTEIIAPYTGRILEILTDQGAIVGLGEPVLRLDLAGRTIKDLEAIVYVPSSNGKRIRPGMSILIAPSTVKQEEYGMMMGRVTYVSDFPATTRGIQRVLKNDRLVGALSGSDAPYEMHADLIPDLNTVSRYRWSSSKGPPLRIQSGTLASAAITVASKRPIELVIPLIRRKTGL